jgi:bifunctional DNA-directed RNA polymerase subunit beta'-beta''
MSTHRHISDEACRELKEVVSFERNLLSAAAWDKVSTSPGHEQIVGSWLLTRSLAEEPEDVKFIGLAKEALTRYDEGLLAFDDWIIVKTDDGQRLKTNMGALVHWELTGILPTQVLDKKGVKKYLLELCRTYGNDAYKYLTKLQRLWFRTSTKFGLSLAYDDVKKSPEQQALIDEVKAMPKDMDFDERIKAWDTNINKAVKNWFEKTDRNSSMIAMANSGARVTPVQVRQMIVSKGLLTSMQGGLEEPIPEALSEGLPVLSYIRTCGPARRGLAMNSFMVPASGYLERQLVNLCRDLNITTHDCKAEKGIELESSKAEGKVLAEPVGDLKRGTILYKHLLKDLPKTVVVRSPIMCEHDNGLCAVCCGLNPATQDFYRLGTGIGVMAGTSTGEPLSQAGLRGKHSSGSVTLADLEYTVGNAVADFIKATGAQATSFLDIASSEAKPATSFNDLPYDQAAKAVLMELHRIFDESGIDIYTTLLETIVRGLSDVVVLSNGQSFLRSKGYNDPNPKFRTVVDSVSQNPSILKRLGFGWARQALENSVKNADGYQHLPVEKLMMGKLIHDCDRKEV